MRPFLVCIHDATPAYARETRLMIRYLAPLVGRRISFGVVPDWHGAWPLAAHADYCHLLQDTSAELLLHGYCHERRQGRGPVTWLTNGADEMNGLDAAETLRTLERGQRVFGDVFGHPARGFLAPAWQRGHVRVGDGSVAGLEYVLGFFSVDATDGRSVPLATATWDCGRWRWLGHVGHGFGRALRSLTGGVPTLAIHPVDLERGFWPQILRLTRTLIESGHEPITVAGLLEARDVEVRF